MDAEHQHPSQQYQQVSNFSHNAQSTSGMSTVLPIHEDSMEDIDGEPICERDGRDDLPPPNQQLQQQPFMSQHPTPTPQHQHHAGLRTGYPMQEDSMDDVDGEIGRAHV